MPRKAIDLYPCIQNPSDVTVALLLNACAQLETDDALDVVKKVASEMPTSSRSNVYVITSMLDALMKCGDLTKAQSLFDATPNKVVPMYGAMMAGELCVLLSESVSLFVLVRLHEEQSAEQSNRPVQKYRNDAISSRKVQFTRRSKHG
jgi:hypothetical protein